MNAAQIAAALGMAKPERGGWRCTCPAHEDHNPSLSVTDADGKLLVYCHAGCPQAAVVDALKNRGLWLSTNALQKFVETYDYRDEDSVLRYQVVRNFPKRFLQRRPDRVGNWIWNMRGVEPLPYRLPELIASSDRIVFIPEGEKDCDRLAALGEVATCNHGGAGKWSTKLNRHFIGRDVVILRDNDEPGLKHAQMVATQLYQTAKTLSILLLPGLPEKGDVSDWFAAGGTPDALLNLVRSTEEWKPSAVVSTKRVLDPRAPLNIARVIAESKDSRPLRHHRGSFYEWQKSYYEEIDDDDIAAMVYDFLSVAKRKSNSGEVDFNPKRSDVENILHALKSHPLVYIRSRCAAPTWLRAEIGDTPLLACTNGLLRLSDGNLVAHSPDYFNISAVDFEYDPKAPEPVEWLRFLSSVWGDDQQSRETLQEMFGYILVGDQSQQKMFLLVGPKRSGKGTIGRILNRLVGRGGHAGPTLASLSRNFGLAPLINKTVAIVPDARLKGNSHEIVEQLLAISGGDELTIDRKYKSAWTGRLLVRFVFLTNEVPGFSDNSGALASRFIALEFRNSFLGREDLKLEERLNSEMPGILNWSIEGWRRLKQRGYFIQPTTAAQSVRILNRLASPIDAFLSECCDLNEKFEINTTILFEAWCTWCAENGRDHPGTKEVFGRDLHAARPEIRTQQRRSRAYGSTHERLYVGIRLKDHLSVQHDLLIDDAARSAMSGPPPDLDTRG